MVQLRSHAVQHRVKTRPRPLASHSRAAFLELNGLAMMRPPNCRSHEPKHCAPRVQDEMPEGILGSKYVDMDLNNIESLVYKKKSILAKFSFNSPSPVKEKVSLVASYPLTFANPFSQRESRPRGSGEGTRSS